ncbi:hypothetical protein A5634_04140 [Mycobacterium asiaticum]|uniref:HTH tetR-type domain-containing protein n=1 Tax=Mycobacterium asiaticum TaxID=1790 RepID=A0A1A3NT09_MYCAS|nr:hypothetical protein A5634_04140 [Mycobacterium asiaticum]
MIRTQRPAAGPRTVSHSDWAVGASAHSHTASHTAGQIASHAAGQIAEIINAAERFIADAGIEALTIRELSIATGFPAASIRQLCGSRAALIGATWLRAYRRFLSLLTSLVEETDGSANEKAFAAAEASVLYRRQYPRSAALLEAVQRDDLSRRPQPTDVARQLREVDDQFVDIMRRLSLLVWDRDDTDSIAVMSACVIDLPKRILGRHECHGSYFVREYVREAVRGVLDCGPPTDARQRADAPALMLSRRQRMEGLIHHSEKVG